MYVCYEIAIARSRSTLQLHLLSDYDYNFRLLKRKWAAGSPNCGCVFLFLFWRYLMELVERHGQQCWSVIATFLAGCIGKQCRKRGHNHLRLTSRLVLPTCKNLIETAQENPWALKNPITRKETWKNEDHEQAARVSERQFVDHTLRFSPTFGQKFHHLSLQEVVQKNCLKNLFNNFLWPSSACWGAWVHVTVGTRRKKKFLFLHITILAINGLTLPSSFHVELKMHQESLECNN